MHKQNEFAKMSRLMHYQDDLMLKLDTHKLHRRYQ